MWKAKKHLLGEYYSFHFIVTALTDSPLYMEACSLCLLSLCVL